MDQTLQLIRPAPGETVSLLTPVQRDFVEHHRASAAPAAPLDWLHLVRQEDAEDYTQSQKVAFCWTGGGERSLFRLQSSYGEIVIETEGQTALVDNLFVGTDYRWSVESGGERAERFFRTADQPPRFLTVEGITNVRDLGGWRGLDGRRLRQGLVYRGSELDRHLDITPQGIRTMTESLHIRTDFDMREEVVGLHDRSVLSAYGTAWQLLPIRPYGEIGLPEQREAYRRAFRLFLDPDNYPIYAHCWGGADRTGTFFLLLEALCGVCWEDLLLDYEITSLSVWGDRSRETELFQNLTAFLDSLGEPAEPVRQKAERYLLSAGITLSEIHWLRDFLLE